MTSIVSSLRGKLGSDLCIVSSYSLTDIREDKEVTVSGVKRVYIDDESVKLFVRERSESGDHVDVSDDAGDDSESVLDAREERDEVGDGS